MLLTADLYGIESHGIQRLIRYYKAMEQGSIVPSAEARLVFETPISAVFDAPKTMGQVVGNFWCDVATTVVTRGKLEVYNKKELPLPAGWAADETGDDSLDAARVLGNTIGKLGGGIFPLGGYSEESGSHKGYGLGIIRSSSNRKGGRR